MENEKSGIFQDLIYYVAKCGVEFVRILPLKAAFTLATVLGNIFYFTAFPIRARMIRQILHASIAKNKKEAADLARRNCIHMFKIGLEFMIFDKYITPQNLPDHIKLIYS